VRISYHVMSAPSPIGLLFLAATERGLRCVEFLDRRSIKRVIASHEAEQPGAEWRPSLLDLAPAVDQLEAYFHGERRRFELPLDPVGTEFQRLVWTELTRIPFGETRSYGQIAAGIGQPKASRAVGLANNQNPLPIVVPCHRVVGARGDLVGYGGGLPRKKWLLHHETRFSRLFVVPGESVPMFAPPRPGVAATGGRAATVAKAAPAPRSPAGARRPAAAGKRAAVAAPAVRGRSGPSRPRRSAAPRRPTSARRARPAGR
jgi:methylated-DNA-[protein]-cysteine S-methyltransferase